MIFLEIFLKLFYILTNNFFYNKPIIILRLEFMKKIFRSIDKNNKYFDEFEPEI